MNTPVTLFRSLAILLTLYAVLSLTVLDVNLTGDWEATFSSGPVNLHIALRLDDDPQ